MNRESAVTFTGNTRIHIGLGVENLDRSIEFYRTLFGQGPVKIREGYAKFEVSDPSVNLALNQVGSMAKNQRTPESHFGIQVQSTEMISEALTRFRAGGLETAVEEDATCCYAVQDKVWVTDPDGHHWEVFVVLEADAERHSKNTSSQCCDGAQTLDNCTPSTVGCGC